MERDTVRREKIMRILLVLNAAMTAKIVIGPVRRIRIAAKANKAAYWLFLNAPAWPRRSIKKALTEK